MIQRIGFGAVMFVLAGMAGADVVLQQPIDCDLAEDCVIQQFVDHGEGAVVTDFACGHATYDGHKGTDFRVRPMAMKRGVDVLAAADGVVLRLRNDMDDKRMVNEADFAAVRGKDCGNGMVLRHKDGWETQYCHMKKGSVRVTEGQEVLSGDVIGQVGLSGNTQFPHLHISVRKDGKVIDPFAPDHQANRCTYEAGKMLWEKGFAEVFTYQPTRVFLAGLADKRVEFSDIMDGKWAGFEPSRVKPLVIYGLAVNGNKGDQLQLILRGPEGVIVNSTRDPLQKSKASWSGFGGERPPAGGWPVGRYETLVQIIRDGAVLYKVAGGFSLK